MLSDVYELSFGFLEKYNRSYKRYFLERNALDHRFSIIVGQRGVGKTTAIVQKLLSLVDGKADSEDILYVQADHFTINKYSLYEIAEAFYRRGGKAICFDEIHKYGNWSQELKSINDTFTQLKIIASGSSVLEIHKGSHDLSRRAVRYQMHGMSFREFIELTQSIKLPSVALEHILRNHRKISRSIVHKIEESGNKVLALFEDYLKWGFYPYFTEFQDRELFRTILEQNLHTIIEADLVSVHPQLTGQSVRKIKKLLSFLAGSVPYTPDLGALKSIVDVSDNRTLKTYLKYLEDAGAIIQIGKAGREHDSLQKAEKIYLNNPNQIFALERHFDQNKGTSRETFFANQLIESHAVRVAKRGDFKVNDTWVFEIGGKNKTSKQLKNVPNSYLALDDIEIGTERVVPLWLFGFLY